MTSKIQQCDQDVFDNGKSVCLVDIPKEAAEDICRNLSAVTGCKVDWHYIGGRVHIKALAAPEAPRQDAIGTLKRVGQNIIFDAIGDPHIRDGMEVFTAPLSPDHSGGAREVVPVAWANWKVGTRSYVPFRSIEEAQRSVSASELAATQQGPYQVAPLYASHTAPTINENAEFEKWRNTQIDVLVRNGYHEGAEAFRNLGSVQWAGWQARACLDKVKELNQ